MKSLSYRAHSWMADNFRGIQYPRKITTIGAGWRNSMPFGIRVLIAIAGAILAIAGIGLLIAAGVFVWSVLR